MKMFPARSQAPGAVAGGVAAQARGQAGPPDEAEGDGRHRRREHRAEHGHDDVRGEHDRQCRRPGDRQCATCQGDDPRDKQATLGARRVDERTDRDVQCDPDQTAHGKHRADGRLVH
jgi:hypothetical protein